MGVRGARAAHVIRPAAALLQLLPLPCMSNSDAIRVAPHAPCWCDWRAPPLVIADTAPARGVVLLLLLLLDVARPPTDFQQDFRRKKAL